MTFNWLEFMRNIFQVIIPLIVTFATGYFISWIKVKKQELLQKTEDETTRKYIELLDQTIITCVLATNQTYVETLKSEGVFDASAHKKAFELTYSTVLDILTEDAQIYLSEAIGDLSAYITSKIEAQVAISKY